MSSDYLLDLYFLLQYHGNARYTMEKRTHDLRTYTLTAQQQMNRLTSRFRDDFCLYQDCPVDCMSTQIFHCVQTKDVHCRLFVQLNQFCQFFVRNRSQN